MRTTIKHIRKLKNQRPISMLSLYEHYFARLCDQAELDMVLIGDSLGNVVYGYRSTLPVDLEMMIRHSQAVVRATEKPLVVVDMPFMTYQSSLEQALLSAGTILQKTEAQAVKLEGSTPYLQEVIRRMSESGIPVMGHLGLTPQSINMIGSYAQQGKTADEAAVITRQALELQEAGCFSIVLENIPDELAGSITRQLAIPTIGIGAGPQTDGQVLVLHDILGLDETYHPKFVKRYANLQPIIMKAMQEYVREVHSGQFPANIKD